MPISALFAGLIALLAPVNASAADTENFYFQSFDADYYLEKTASGSLLRVAEQLVAVFPDYEQNHGLTRAIPYTTLGGQQLTVQSQSALDFSAQRNGRDEPFTLSREDGYYLARIGSSQSYVTGRQTYELSYQFTNVITDQSGSGSPISGASAWQELYWNTNGTGWVQSFQTITARLHLPDNLASAVEPRCYVGTQGSNYIGRCEIQLTADGYQFTAQNLAARENLTFVLAFPAGSFEVNAPSRDYTFLICVIGLILGNLACLIIAFAATAPARQIKRDYRQAPVPPQYIPPRGYTVAELATNYVGSATLKNPQVATLLELAVAHRIEFTKGAKKRDWQITVKNAAELQPWQADVLKILAGSSAAPRDGQVIALRSNAAQGMESEFKHFRSSLRASLVQKGDRRAKSAAKPTPRRIAATIYTAAWGLASLGISAWVLGIASDPAPGCEIVGLVGGAGSDLAVVAAIGIAALNLALVIIAAVLLGSSRKYELITPAGLELSHYLDGLKLYIGLAEAERLQLLQSVEGAELTHQGIVKLYERLLPYAELLGLEKSWLKELERYYQYDDVSDPDWCQRALWQELGFYSLMNTLTSTARAAQARYGESSSGSSSSSGFSGGFSGGGGGGGGGGGW